MWTRGGDFHRDRGYSGRGRRKDLIIPLVALEYSARLSFLNFRSDTEEDSWEKVAIISDVHRNLSMKLNSNTTINNRAARISIPIPFDSSS